MTKCMDVALHSGGVTGSGDKVIELCTYKNDQGIEIRSCPTVMCIGPRQMPSRPRSDLIERPAPLGRSTCSAMYEEEACARAFD